MDEIVVRHLDFSDYDVVMFYDYNNLETDFDFSLLKEYRNKSLIAWSMGVMVATLFDKIEKFIKEHKNKERGKMICLKKY